MSPLPQFVVGSLYSRKNDIHRNFGGNAQSGIAASSKVPAIFLFTGDSGLRFGYRDSPEASEYCDYTGEGQSGDMTFTAGNKAIRDHIQDGRTLHLFKALGKSKPCRYLGEFSLLGHSMELGLDREQKSRQLIVFHLVRLKDIFDNEQMPPELPNAMEQPVSLEQAREWAIAACQASSGIEGRRALAKYFERSQRVRRYALMRAKGTCEACRHPAPFKGKQGEPYLEVHHTTRLSDGGLDHPRNVAAVCPTCHREIHCGLDGAELNERVRLSVRLLEG